MAIRSRLGHRIGTDRTAGAAPVLNEHRLAHVLAHALSDQAGHHIGGAACREGHHDLQGLEGKDWAHET